MTDFVTAECMVRQVHARYVDAVWRKDLASFGDCFAEDCEWRIAGHVLAGRGQILEFMSGVFPLFHRILLTMRTPALALVEGGATARTYFTENSVKATGEPLFAIGSYYERFADEGGSWRFKWRAFQTEYAGPVDCTGPMYDNPDWGPPPGMPPLDYVPVDASGNLSSVEVGLEG